MEKGDSFPGRRTKYSGGEKYTQPSFIDLPKEVPLQDIPHATDPFAVDTEADTQQAVPVPDEPVDKNSGRWDKDAEDKEDRIEEALRQAGMGRKP